VQENLCDVVLDLEDEVAYTTDSREQVLEEAAQMVERFNDAPVVIPPNGSLTSLIAKAIRRLA
jgi:hypothetical protein